MYTNPGPHSFMQRSWGRVDQGPSQPEPTEMGSGLLLADWIPDVIPSHMCNVDQ